MKLGSPDIDRVADLRPFLDLVPDPRARRGRWYSLTAILLVCACVAVSGARSVDEIAEWAQRASDTVLTAVGVRRYPLRWRRSPSRTTIGRVLAALDGAAVRTAGTEQAVVGRQGRILLWWLWWPSLPLQLVTYFASYYQLNPVQVWHPLSIRLRGRWRRQVMRYRPRRELLQVRVPQAWDERVVVGVLYLIEQQRGMEVRSTSPRAAPATPRRRAPQQPSTINENQ